jgi:transcription-repair coupling factor (superfamily II helicase)
MVGQCNSEIDLGSVKPVTGSRSFVVQRTGALVEMARVKEKAKSPVLQPPPRDYTRFAARFPFAETEDQARAIEAALRDLASGKPMDRLVCGDVGFGKTEVALRAAAAAVFAGKHMAGWLGLLALYS